MSLKDIFLNRLMKAVIGVGNDILKYKYLPIHLTVNTGLSVQSSLFERPHLLLSKHYKL